MKDVFGELGLAKENETRRKKAAIYARVSTTEQEKQQTVQIQVQRLTKAVEERGWQLVGKYIDEGYSGELFQRPDLDRLLDEIEQKEIDVVLITEPDRLARNFVGQKLLQQQMEEKGVSVEFLSVPPAKTEDEQLGLDILGLISAWERGKIKRRTCRGKVKKAQDGFVVGGKPPYGFRYIERTRETPGRYEINQKEAHWVRKMFQWCAWEGLSVEAIARRLTERRVRTQSGGSVWRKSTVHHILTNETYAGVAHYNKYRSIPPKNSHKTTHYRRLKNTSRELRPKEEWIAISVPPIIDQEAWERAQGQLKRNARRSPRNTRHPYLLRGKIFCGLCGLPCYGSVSRFNLLYQCSNRHHRSPLPRTCSAKSVSASILDFTVWEALFKALAHPDALVTQLKEIQKTEADKTDYRKEELERLEKRLKKLKKAEARAAELYEYDEEITLKQYNDEVQKIRVERQRVKREMAELEQQIKRMIDWEEIETNIKFLYADITSRLHMLGFEDKRKIIELLLDKVVITGDKVRIEGIVPPIQNLATSSPNAVGIASKPSPCEVQNHIN